MAVAFLNLPSNVRKNIYAEAGLVRVCWIDLGRRPEPRDVSSLAECFYRRKLRGSTIIGRKGPDCVCPRLPTELLLVCKAVSDEAHAVLYGCNRFLLRGHAASDLVILRLMSARALRAMRFLLLRLNCWPCPNGHDDVLTYKNGLRACVNCGTPLSRGDPPWSAGDPAARDLLTAWESLCEYLAASISPGKLHLTLICDSQDLGSGKLIVDRLMSLPPLAACTIRLGRRKDQYPLTALAQSSSLRLTRSYLRPATQSRFPFEALPAEIRLRILEFTHLGAKIAYARPRLRIEHGKLVLRDPVPLYGAVCCFQCTRTFADCCCPTTHASYAPGCTCRVLPMELFLVSRQMRQDAMAVFYPASNFDFMQSHEETLGFLSRLPPGAVRLLRSFRICFPREHFHSWISGGHAEQFYRLVVFIKNNMDLTRLRLTIDTHRIDDDCLWVEEAGENRFVYDVYVDIVSTLCLLRGLEWVEFDIGWAKGLIPWMTSEVLGQRHTQDSATTDPPSRPHSPYEAVPAWHSNSMMVDRSNRQSERKTLGHGIVKRQRLS